VVFFSVPDTRWSLARNLSEFLHCLLLHVAIKVLQIFVSIEFALTQNARHFRTEEFLAFSNCSFGLALNGLLFGLHLVLKLSMLGVQVLTGKYFSLIYYSKQKIIRKVVSRF
jgi:hypothetical protein